MKFWQEVDGLLLRQAAKQSDAVRAAIVRSVPVEDIVNRWAEAHPTEGTIMPADARAWAQMNAIIPIKPLADVLDHVHAIGWVMGDDASTAAFARAAQGITKAAPSDEALKISIRTNWDKWKPGNKPAALLVRPPGAFAALLEQGRATVKGINSTIADRIGTVLADSLNSGDTYTTLSKKFLADTITAKVVKNPLHAEMIAVTEMSRAFNASTVNNYTEFGVELVEWLAIDAAGCSICPANAAQGPIPLGQPFQSGETAPPAHPHCRCTLIPVVDEGKPMTDEEFAQALIGGSPAPVVETPISDVLSAAKPAEFKPSDWSTVNPLVATDISESRAVLDYTANSYEDINKVLSGREGRSLRPMTEQAVEKAKKEIMVLDRVMDQSVIPENIVVQRRATAEELGIDKGAIFRSRESLAGEAAQTVGKVIQYDSFISTSTTRFNGKEFEGVFAHREIHLTMNIPAGTRGGKPTNSAFPDEREVIIDRGSVFVIESATPDPNSFKLNVVMTLVEQVRKVI